jgi:hypothetical protein
VTADLQELTKNVNYSIAKELEQQWKSSQSLDCIEGKFLIFTYNAQQVFSHVHGKSFYCATCASIIKTQGKVVLSMWMMHYLDQRCFYITEAF